MLITYPYTESQDTKYAYAVGRVRALEDKLLPANRIARLLEAEGGDELLRILQDTAYSQWLPETPRDYELIIKQARGELYKLIDKLILEQEIIEQIRLKYDYYNAKVITKGTIGEKEIDELLSTFGNINPQEMKSIFQEERYDKLPYLLSNAIPEAIEVYYARKDPRFLDILLDKYYYFYLRRRDENIFLNTLTKIEIDLVNIKTFFRVRLLKEESKLLKEAFIGGGFLKLTRFLDPFDEPIEGVPRYFEYTPYARVVSEGVEYLQSKNSFLRLEKLCDDYFMEFLKRAKYLTFGVEPLIAYFYAKENEFKMLRMIFVGKLNAVPGDLIKERLPEVY